MAQAADILSPLCPPHPPPLPSPAQALPSPQLLIPIQPWHFSPNLSWLLVLFTWSACPHFSCPLSWSFSLALPSLSSLVAQFSLLVMFSFSPCSGLFRMPLIVQMYFLSTIKTFSSITPWNSHIFTSFTSKSLFQSLLFESLTYDTLHSLRA